MLHITEEFGTRGTLCSPARRLVAYSESDSGVRKRERSFECRDPVLTSRTAGLRGVWVGSVLGGCLALPVALIEIGIRYILPEEEILPVLELKSDPPQSVSRSIAEDLELQLEMQKHFESQQNPTTSTSSNQNAKKKN